MPIDIELQIPDQRWHPDVESAAYLVACEALANVAKHAEATQANVPGVVESDPTEIRVSVRDDGQGAPTLNSPESLRGLRNSTGRAGRRPGRAEHARAGDARPGQDPVRLSKEGLPSRQEPGSGRQSGGAPPPDRGAAVRVALADDSALFRDGLAVLLRAAGAEVVVQARTGDQVMAAVPRAARRRDRRHPDAAHVHQ